MKKTKTRKEQNQKQIINCISNVNRNVNITRSRYEYIIHNLVILKHTKVKTKRSDLQIIALLVRLLRLNIALVCTQMSDGPCPLGFLRICLFYALCVSVQCNFVKGLKYIRKPIQPNQVIDFAAIHQPEKEMVMWYFLCERHNQKDRVGGDMRFNRMTGWTVSVM